MHFTPLYPDFKPLSLEDRDHFRSFFRRHPPVISELTFTNLFMWRHHYRFQWCLAAESLLITAKTANGEPFALPPVGTQDVTSALRQLLNHLSITTPTPQIHRFPTALAKDCAKALSLKLLEDRANSDYVYRTESLITLRGRKLHGKRNHLKKFRRQYHYDYQALDDKLIGACLELEENWCRLRDCSANQSLRSEEQAIREALLYFHELDCQGAAIVVDDKVVAFSLGEPLNPDTAVIHVEKANPEFPGSYAVINQEFCQNAWKDFTYVNREQDLGDPGLRQSKLSYHPDHLLNKVILHAAARGRWDDNGADPSPDKH